VRAAFLGYGAVGLGLALLYRGMPHGAHAPARGPAPAAPSPAPAPPARPARTARPLARSRRVVLQLSALFSLDSFGGGFAVQSLLVLWLLRRFEMPVEQAAAVMSASALLAALSQLASAPLARRIGLVRTMVFTHIPANVFLVAAAFMPSAAGAVACLVLRSSLSQMDVPARQAYVMSVVPPEERAAAASVTNVPRSLATAASPLLAGALLARTTFGWPLVIGGVLKLTYDLLLLAAFGRSEVPSGDPGSRREDV
jgi:MFS family permease